MPPFVLSVILLVSFSLSYYDYYPLQHPIIQLPKGFIKGKIGSSVSNKTFYKFEKIPFAKPPLGSLRFEPPVPPDSWNGILDTFEMDTSCYQTQDDGYPDILMDVSEDCLYLNVYTPMLPTKRKNVSLPVLFYIHGGGFVFDSAMPSFAGPEYLIDENIVIVTTNYRLGVLGFLSTEDLIAPGNWGLKDQKLALEWANENVALFGGDPNRIVIYGESAGGASVTHQLLNKNNEGKFRGVIASSGSVVDEFAIKFNLRKNTHSLAVDINPDLANINNSEAWVEFLRQVPVELLFKYASNYLFSPNLEPEHDEAFITKGPFKLVRDGEFNRVPLFIGFNSEEGLLFPMDAEQCDLDNARLVPEDMNIKDDKLKVSMGKKIKNFYSGDQLFADNPGALIRFATDNIFTRGILKHADLHSRYHDVFVYQFSYDGQLGNFPYTVPGTEHVGHAEDLHYIWCDRYCSKIHTYPLSDRITQKRLIRLFTNFIKYLNPTPESEEILGNIKVPTFNETDRFYVNINETVEILIAPRKENIEFWEYLYKSLGTDDFNTY